MSKWDNAVQKNLLKPFDTIKWKPQVTTRGKNKEPIMRNGQRVAGCTAHIDARDVMNRLDEVVGAENWSDAYAIIGSRNVECRLTVLEVTKCDIGEINEGGFADPFKSAYSDALKRAAVKFGIGRYLYGMEMEWLLFDGYKIIEQPGPTTVPPPNGKLADKRGDTSPQGQKAREGHRPTGENSKPKVTNGNEQEPDHLALALVANNLKAFALNAFHIVDGYGDEFNVVGALTQKWPEAHGQKVFRFTSGKIDEYLQWLADRKEAENG